MSSHDIACSFCGAVGAYDQGCPECQVPPEEPVTTKPAMQAVRGLDADIWRRVRAAGVVRKLTAGEQLNEILREWLARQET